MKILTPDALGEQVQQAHSDTLHVAKSTSDAVGTIMVEWTKWWLQLFNMIPCPPINGNTASSISKKD